jgi:multidrug efflux pump subunit AcrA (membrane-fusion protein)
VLEGPQGERSVFIVEDETARRVPVGVGEAREGVTEISSGLSEGQQVITMGHDRLRDGAKVRLAGSGGTR